MYITCLDVEGVLVPEIWIAFAEESGIPELKRTTTSRLYSVWTCKCANAIFL